MTKRDGGKKGSWNSLEKFLDDFFLKREIRWKQNVKLGLKWIFFFKQWETLNIKPHTFKMHIFQKNYAPWRGFPGDSVVKNLPSKEIQVWLLGLGDPLEREMVMHSSILAWEILWTEEPGRLSSVESQKVWHDFSSVTRSCPTLCDPMDCSTPSLPEFPQTHVHWVSDDMT